MLKQFLLAAGLAVAGMSLSPVPAAHAQGVAVPVGPSIDLNTGRVVPRPRALGGPGPAYVPRGAYGRGPAYRQRGYGYGRRSYGPPPGYYRQRYRGAAPGGYGGPGNGVYYGGTGQQSPYGPNVH